MKNLDNAIIEYYISNYENGIDTMARVFNKPPSVISKIINKYLKSLKINK